MENENQCNRMLKFNIKGERDEGYVALMGQMRNKCAYKIRSETLTGRHHLENGDGQESY
jgi:hypothetical protein